MFPDEINYRGQIYIPEIVPDPMQYYRVPHDIERVSMDADNTDLRYRGNAGGKPRSSVLNTGEALPEMYRLDPEHHTILDCSFQRLWKNLNPDLSNAKWSTLLGNDIAWTNGTGFPGHYNCLTGEGLGLPFPRFDIPRVCGGAVLAGIEQDGRLWIDSMVVTRPAKPAGDVLRNPAWWFWATSINSQGEINFITREGIDGNRYPVRVPLLTTYSVCLPLDQLHKLPLGFVPPDARWIP